MVEPKCYRYLNMVPTSLFIIAQLIYAAFILGISSQPNILQQTKHGVKNVLGVSMLAQDTTPPSEPVPSVAEPSPPESSSVSPSSAPETPSPTTSSQPESSNISPTQPATEETPPASPTTTQAETGTVTPSPEETSSVTPSPTLAPLESSVSQTEAVLNPENVMTDVEHIDKEAIDKVKKEEESISQVQTSDEKEKLLITFAKDKVNDIEKNLKEDDFASTAFATVRLTDEIDQATQGIQLAPAELQEKLTQQVSDFCREADLKLRTQELSVPEAFEQDMEISRAKCFDYQ